MSLYSMRCYKSRKIYLVALILGFLIRNADAAVCTEGSLNLHLVSATGTAATTHPFAKCFNSITLSVLTDCTLQLTNNGDNSFVPALWSAAATYNQLKGCPAGVSLAFTDATDATATTGLATLLATSIYADGMTASVSAASGVITITSTYLTNEATLKYRSSATTGSATGFFNTVGAPTCETVTECAATATGCSAGSYSVPIGATGTYVCALCSSGSYSAAEATSCSKCLAGNALAAVGSASNSCSVCSAGSFATLGSSDCRPCEPTTYQNAGSSSSCISCPTSWSSHTYGATECIKCVNGRPEVCTGASCDSDTAAGSGASFTASVANDATWTTKASWPATYAYPALFETCSSASTLLSFTVSATCTIEIRALAKTTTTTNGKACSDPTNTASSVTAYYIGVSTIMNRLSNTVDKGNILKIVNAAATTVTMSVTAATSYPIEPTGSVTGVLTVNGGDLAGADGGDTCPAGTYKTGSGATLSCPACNPGYYCPVAATIGTAPCDAGSYSTLGQASCTSCSPSTYSSSPGASQCLACASPYIVGNSGTTCNCGVGKQFNPATNACDCAPGYRASDGAGTCTICPSNTYSSGGPSDVIVASCSPCSPNQISAAGSEICSSCPSGQLNIGGACSRCNAGQEIVGSSCVACSAGYYNPNSGGFSQFDTCQRCAAGSASGDGISCIPCSAGAFSVSGSSKCILCAGGGQANAARTGCEKCSAGFYRDPFSTGPCLACTAGTASKSGESSCSRCKPGEYSAEGASECSRCISNFYSTDAGSIECFACKPGTTTNGNTGATSCSGCPIGTAFNSTTKVCDVCQQGYYQNREGENVCKRCPIGTFSDTTGSATCELCSAGKYNPIAGSNSCRVCPGGTYSSAGKGSCSLCGKGKFSSPGSVACSSCTAGYYANKIGYRVCTACPVGSKCPGVAATAPTLCAAGSFQSKAGQTTCSPCPRKTYINKAGAKRCVVCSTANTVGTSNCPAPTPSRKMLRL